MGAVLKWISWNKDRLMAVGACEFTPTTKSCEGSLDTCLPYNQQWIQWLHFKRMHW